MKRIQSIDIVRGIVMIIMALDHVRDLMHIDSLTQSPTNLETTTPSLFFTRWITYLCAPIFVFLAGCSVYLSIKDQNNLYATRSLLLKRGLLLLFIEFSFVNFGLYFDIGFHTLLFEVIASTGLGFIVLGLLLNKSSKLIVIIGLSILLLHNLITLIPFRENDVLKIILNPFFAPNAIPLIASKILIIGYPPIPWLGIMLVGYSCGRFFKLQKENKESLFLKIGIGAISIFFLLRFVNLYGDSNQWAVQKTFVLTILSFFNISKYPPSLDFCLITLGIMFILLSFAERWPSSITRITLTYGRVPLFYFLLHFYLIHIILLLLLLIQGFQWNQFEFITGNFGRPKDQVSGLPLGAIYLIWIFVVAILYKPCAWYGKYKSRHNHWWLKYL